jgi:hypothetical protein
MSPTYGQYSPGHIRGDDLPEPVKPPKNLGAGCWALADARGAFWDGSRHISGLPMTTILEVRAFRFPTAEAAEKMNIGAGFMPVRIFTVD